MKAKKVLEGYDTLVRLIGVAETNRRLGVKGRQAVHEARAKVEAKAMRRALDEAQLRTGIVEALTSAAAPQAAPGAGAAPAAGDRDDGLFGAMARQSRRVRRSGQLPL